MRKLVALLLSIILAYSICSCSVSDTYSQCDTSESKTEYLTNEFENYNVQPTDFLWAENEDGITLTKYIGDSEKVCTPREIGGKPVTQIGNGAFTTDIIGIALNDNPSIDDWIYETKYGNAKSIIISEGVEIIGDFAFSNAQIKEVSLPSTIRVLGEKSFFESSVELIELSSDNPVIIGEKAFQHCSNLKKIQIDKIKKLNWDAVYYCEKLECISGIDEETELIGEHPVDSDVFCECRRLNAVKSGNWWYIIINGEAYISDYSGVETKLVIPDTIDGYIVKGIGKSAFGSLDEGYEPQKTGMRYTEIIMPDTIEIIEPYAFDCCEELVNIYISCNLKSIGDNAFRGCNNLEKIIIPNGIDEIGDILGWTETKEKVEIIYMN